MDPAYFYAANGWGSTANISSVFFYWVAAAGIAILPRRNPVTPDECGDLAKVTGTAVW
jgi:hypothetical protein